MMSSKQTLILGFIIIFLTSFFYYPKWNKVGTESTLSWDVSGYYWYLPSVFIYKDLKEQKFAPSILEKYGPTPDLQQFFKNRNGAYVMKYSIGQALQYLPFFAIAHFLAEPLGFKADGFSPPYQLAIQLGSILMCFLGLWFLRKSLLIYFSDVVTSFVLAIIIFATNYFNFAAIDGALTHNWLFTWYSLLIYTTIGFYKRPSYKKALAIGGIVGICALTRPTDIISMIIPLLWGLNSLNKTEIIQKISSLWGLRKLLFVAAILTFCIGMIQLFYFKYAGGEWLVYSYGDQSFSWLHPHFHEYMFSFRTGWLLYTPIFFLGIFGAFFLRKKKIGYVSILLFILINTYIVTAWDVWWYGGRAMVQSYPIWSFLLAVTVEKMLNKTWLKYVLFSFIALCIYYNIWWTHGVHKGGYFDPYDSTKAYFYKQVGKWSFVPERMKLYDTNELFEGLRKDIKVIYENNFNTDSAAIKSGVLFNGSPAISIDGNKQYSSIYDLPIKPGSSKWLRVNSTFLTKQKEWTNWMMPQMIVIFKNEDKIVKQNMFRVHRFISDHEVKELYLDVKLPQEMFNKVELVYWNVVSQKETLIDNILVELFNEK